MAEASHELSQVRAARPVSTLLSRYNSTDGGTPRDGNNQNRQPTTPTNRPSFNNNSPRGGGKKTPGQGFIRGRPSMLIANVKQPGVNNNNPTNQNNYSGDSGNNNYTHNDNNNPALSQSPGTQRPAPARPLAQSSTGVVTRSEQSSNNMAPNQQPQGIQRNNSTGTASNITGGNLQTNSAGEYNMQHGSSAPPLPVRADSQTSTNNRPPLSTSAPSKPIPTNNGSSNPSSPPSPSESDSNDALNPNSPKQPKSSLKDFFVKKFNQVTGKEKKKPKKDESWEVSAPFNLKHEIHVDFNSATGLKGLPPEWEALLQGAGLDRKDVIENKDAVIDILQFQSNYQQQQEKAALMQKASPYQQSTQPSQPDFNAPATNTAQQNADRKSVV